MLTAVLMAAGLGGYPSQAQAQQYASKQREAAAVGYYSRARALMVEALQEFEQGRRFARPDLLIDAEEWRLTLITLTEQLNSVVDPKPRITVQGVRFRAHPRLVKRERDRLPPVPDGAQDSNIYGEQQRMKERQAARAAGYAPREDDADEEEEAVEEEAPAQVQQTEQEAVEQAIEAAAIRPQEQADIPEDQQDELGLSGEEGADDESALEGTEAAQLSEDGLADESKPGSQDQKIQAAIEDAIKERLQSLEVSEASPRQDSEPALDD